MRSVQKLPPVLASVVLFVGTASASLAQDRPITDREPDMVDIAKTPMTDLNLSRTKIPALLVSAQEQPYALRGLDTCDQLVATVQAFDRVLGPDIDLPQSERARFSKGRIAQWVVGSFIPFRGLIREVSGANRNERLLSTAIQAGLARRGFLKGVGMSRGCGWPASPATAQVVAKYRALNDMQAREDDPQPEPRIDPDPDVATQEPAATDTGARIIFTSQPVVQPTR